MNKPPKMISKLEYKIYNYEDKSVIDLDSTITIWCDHKIFIRFFSKLGHIWTERIGSYSLTPDPRYNFWDVVKYIDEFDIDEAEKTLEKENK